MTSQEDDEMTQADPKACLDITEALRQYLLTVPEHHTLDEALHVDYLRNLVGKVNLKPGDAIMLRAAGLSWVARLLVVSVVRASRTVATKLEQAPTFLLSSVDRSQEYLLEQINELEHAHQTGKVGHAEYESRSRTLQHLKEHGHYPTKWLHTQFAALDRAFDAQLLTRQQHHSATQELREVMTEAQVVEVFGSAAAAEAPASNGTEKSKKAKPALVTPPGEFAQLKVTDVRPEIREPALGVVAPDPLMKR